MNRIIPVILVLMLLTGSLVNAHSPQYSEKLRIGPKKIFSRVQEKSRSEKVGYNRGNERLIGAIAPGVLVDPYGYVTSYGYDGFDRISRVTDPLNNVTLIGRANTGNLLSLKQLDATGQQILLQSIRVNDPIGRLTSYTVKMPDPKDDINYTITYNDTEKKVIFTDPMGRETIIQKNDDGRVHTVTDAAGNFTEYTYDERGNVGFVYETVKSADGNQDETKTYTTKYTHNAHNQVETITDLQTQAVTTFYYNEKGNLTGTQDAEGNTITHEYDELGRRTKTEQHFKDTSLKSVETTFEYYPANTYNNITHDGTYSPSNLLKSITDSNGNKTIYEYDNQNRLKKVYYPDGTYPDSSSYVEYIYDINEPTGETNADGKPTYYRVVKEIQRNGTVVKHIYDKLQRLKRREIIPAEGVGGTSFEEYTYDGLSRVKHAANNDTALDFEFDRASRLDNERQAGKLIDYTYNKLSDRFTTELKYPNTRLIEREYDQLNRMKLIKEGTFTIADMTHIGRSYRLLRKQYGNNDLITYLYDQGRRLETLEARNKNTGSLINGYRYGYNKINLKNYEQKLHNAGKGNVFGYDALYRLTNVKFNATDPLNPTEFEREKSINLDNLDNIKSIIESFNGQTRTIDTTITEGSDNWKLNQYERFDQWGLEHDKNGNLTQKGTQKFTYDYRNQLISANDSALLVVMKYDVMGRRVQKAVTKSNQTKVRNYYYAGHQLIEERDGNDQVTRQYIYGNGIDEIIRMDKYEGTAVASYYFHTDSTGSVTAITDSQGNLVERVTYDIYGMPTFWDPAGNVISESLIGNTILFQGREYEPELNLYYYRARYYDPIMGRFLETDPKGYADSMNLYQGFNMNPFNFLDPFGLEITAPVPTGDWNPDPKIPKNRYGQYIGTQIHREIGYYYRDRHQGEEVFTNYISIKTILDSAGIKLPKVIEKGLEKLEQKFNINLKPDILNLSKKRIYEISSGRNPIAGFAKSKGEALAKKEIMNMVGIDVKLGPITDPGVSGAVPAPAGYAVFYSPSPGVILYKYKRVKSPDGKPVPIPVNVLEEVLDSLKDTVRKYRRVDPVLVPEPITDVRIPFSDRLKWFGIGAAAGLAAFGPQAMPAIAGALESFGGAEALGFAAAL